jgi:hypothetical protein
MVSVRTPDRSALMSTTYNSARVRLAWRLLKTDEAIQQLTRATFSGPLPEVIRHGEVAVLYGYREDQMPQLLTWLAARDDDGRRRLTHEAHAANRFEIWLERAQEVDVWLLALVWRFYSEWIQGGGWPHWQSLLVRRFPADEFLDQLLAPTRGWLLWTFQVDQLLFAATGDPDRAVELAKAWRLQVPGADNAFDGMLLPDGKDLLQALRERSPIVNGRYLAGGRPDMHLVAKICALWGRTHQSLRDGR